MSDILSLPPELLSRILDYVPGRDLPNVCITCKTLRDVVYVDSVWQMKCKQVLRRYGDLVGLWRRDFKYFGGLLQIKKGRVLEYKVTDKNYILQKENLTDLPVFRRWISDEFEDDPNANMYFPCYRRRGVDYLSSRHEYRWSPLELPSKDRVNVPIQPGLFKGTYSAHGIEILSLDYNDDLTEVTVTKITVRDNRLDR
uniref:F-box only protein 31-B n=1 Tax=Magallana gigas TaxID=29159 RepID=K1QA04_MAGGI